MMSLGEKRRVVEKESKLFSKQSEEELENNIPAQEELTETEYDDYDDLTSYCNILMATANVQQDDHGKQDLTSLCDTGACISSHGIDKTGH